MAQDASNEGFNELEGNLTADEHLGNLTGKTNTYNDGKLTGVTPSFRGVEPIAPVTINGHTYQSLGQERQAFADMPGSLSSPQQDAARLSSTFRDILLGPGRDGQFPTTRQGIKVGDLSAAQKKLILNTINIR